jgi:hypothetical protein
MTNPKPWKSVKDMTDDEFDAHLQHVGQGIVETLKERIDVEERLAEIHRKVDGTRHG